MNVFVSEYKPGARLEPYIQCFWFGKFNTTNQQNFAQSVLPNGCVELIIHLTGQHCFLAKDGQLFSKTPEFILLGLHTQPFEVKFNQEVDAMGIRFYPDGIRNIFGISPADFITTYENSGDVLGTGSYDFCERLRELPERDAQVQMAEAYLLELLANNFNHFDYTHLIMHAIRQTNGLTEYDQLIQQAPVSERQLQRAFKKHYGITVKDYLRISRMNAVQHYMRQQAMPLTHLTYELEFSDQSHFIREFRNFTGVAPKTFLKNREDFIVNLASTL